MNNSCLKRAKNGLLILLQRDESERQEESEWLKKEIRGLSPGLGEMCDLLANNVPTGGRLVEVIDHSALSLHKLISAALLTHHLDRVQVRVGDGPVPFPRTELGAEEFVDDV